MYDARLTQTDRGVCGVLSWTHDWKSLLGQFDRQSRGERGTSGPVFVRVDNTLSIFHQPVIYLSLKCSRTVTYAIQFSSACGPFHISLVAIVLFVFVG